jgi:hypothetical protein
MLTVKTPFGRSKFVVLYMKRRSIILQLVCQPEFPSSGTKSFVVPYRGWLCKKNLHDIRLPSVSLLSPIPSAT